MKVAIMGAGAIGAYVGARLAQAGLDVALIARGQHLDAIRNDGLSVESPLGEVSGLDLTATDDPADIGIVDLVVFTVKLWDTEAAAQAMKPLIGPHTRVVTLQNGIDSVATISKHVAGDQVVGGTIYLFAVIDRPGVIRNSGGVHKMIFGADNGNSVMGQLSDALERAPGIDGVRSDDVSQVIWQKYIRLVPLSAATALTRKSVGDVRSDATTRKFLQSLLEELVSVAKAEGHGFAGDQVADGMAFYDGLPEQFKSSMLEDVERGNRLELPWLSARVCELGELHAIATPANWAAKCGLHLLAAGSRD
ncbi:2-dehydropantoate 2-reductase [Anderseniella sp. Alg231-50]|uniref:2-dehydropantoate 2-reductase n=1 Tax=Anderseniella sp. Alg231-50 TaxID=1922226 RepID=UPI000D5614F6